MSLRVLREITSAMQKALFYTVMVDETTDCLNKEQAVIVIRWLKHYWSVQCTIYRCQHTYHHHKRFSGATELEHKQNPRTVLQWSLQYDWCKEVSKQIMNIERHALFTHCYGLTLNLACSDAVKGAKF